MEQLSPLSYNIERVRRLIKGEKATHHWKLKLGTSLYVVMVELDQYSSQLRVTVDGSVQVQALYYGKYLSKYTVRLGDVVACVFPANDEEFDIAVSGHSCLNLLRQCQSVSIRPQVEKSSEPIGLEDVQLDLIETLQNSPIGK